MNDVSFYLLIGTMVIYKNSIDIVIILCTFCLVTSSLYLHCTYIISTVEHR